MEYFFHHWFNPKDVEWVKCRKHDQFSPELQKQFVPYLLVFIFSGRVSKIHQFMEYT